jgi:hypothetical protein
MQISQDFKRASISKDLYFVKCVSEEMCYTKQLFFGLSKNFYWEGPIHEYLRTDLPETTYDTVVGIQIQYRVIGGSWQTNLENKFLNYAQKLTSFVQSGHKEYRWMYYIANSYVAAADSARTEERKKESLLLAKKYYEDVLKFPSLDRDQQFTVCDKLSQCMEKMGMAWCDIRQASLKAHKVDKRHAEPIARIIEYYITEGRWETAYIYSSFAFSTYHLHLPTDRDITEVRRCLYEWRILYYHYLVCMHTNREEEGRKLYKQLKERSSQEINQLKNDELTMIRLSSPGIIGLQQRLIYFKKWVGTVFFNKSKNRLEWEG